VKTPLQKSQRQERNGAQAHGGTQNSGSGNGWVRKNDVRTPELSIEYKHTDKKQFPLKEVDLLLAERNALLDGRDMVFGISFHGGRNWVVISEEDFLTMRGQ
jgi:hypothetical protein